MQDMVWDATGHRLAVTFTGVSTVPVATVQMKGLMVTLVLYSESC